MTSPRRCRVVGLLFVITLTAVISLSAQSPNGQRGRLRADRVDREVEPSFKITPFLHKFDARRGQTLPFEFTAQADGLQTTLEIRPVALRQQENGVILPDLESPPPSNVRINTPPRIDIKAGDRFIIKGTVRVENLDSNFQSYGILVRDLGRLLDRTPDDANPRQAQVGVKFITQYLLRCDINVIGSRGENARELLLDSAALVEVDGNANAQVRITNPTDQPFEFETRCRLTSVDGGSHYRSFHLVLPIRVNQPAPDRNRARILAKSTVQVEEFLPYPVFPGEYGIEVEILDHGRTVKTQSFRVVIQEGEFPAQDASIVRVSRDILVEPPQVELSLQRGGQRFQSITLTNNSEQLIAVALSPRMLGAELADAAAAVPWLRVSPDSFSLRPHMKRKILLGFSSGDPVDSHMYAMLRLDVRPEAGEALGGLEIPIALLARNEVGPEIEAGPIRLDNAQTRPAFVVPVLNVGTRHLSLKAHLRMADAFGRGIGIESGYGRWLLPGQSSELQFPIKYTPPPGIYDLTAEIDMGFGNDPVTVTETFRLSPAGFTPETAAATTNDEIVR